MIIVTLSLLAFVGLALHAGPDTFLDVMRACVTFNLHNSHKN